MESFIALNFYTRYNHLSVHIRRAISHSHMTYRLAETVPSWFLLNLKVVQVIVRRISARVQYNCAKNGKGLKIGTKEADTT